MKTLILTSCFKAFYTDEKGNKIPCEIDNANGFLDNLKKYLKKRNCMVIISGNPKKFRADDPNEITKQYLEMSGIGFKEIIYVNDSNKHLIVDFIKRADCINLFGGHLPTANAFVNELNLKQLLKDFDGVVIGGSGGAMNMADVVYCIPEVEGEHTNTSFNRYLPGLGLTDINIIPHWNFFRDFSFSDGVNMVNDILLPDSKKSPLIALPDCSYIIQEGEIKKVFGEAYLIEYDRITQICKNNESIILK